MSGAENFIRWYANRIATSDMVDARNKLFNIRAKNPKMYEFLVSEFKGDSPKPQYRREEEDDEYRFVKDRVRYKKPDQPSQSSTMVSRMIVDSSVPRRTNIPMYTQMSTSSNIPETKMLSAMDYDGYKYPAEDLKDHDGYKYPAEDLKDHDHNIPRRKPLPDNVEDQDDDLRYLEELAKERRLNKQGIYTKMASRRNVPDETQTFMARESNIPPSLNKNQMRFLRGDDYEK